MLSVELHMVQKQNILVRDAVECRSVCVCLCVWAGWGHSHASETRIADVGSYPVKSYLIGCIIRFPFAPKAELNIRRPLCSVIA